MSDTLRTDDEESDDWTPGVRLVPADFARTLERELATANDAAAKGETARQQCGGMEMEIADLRADLDKALARLTQAKESEQALLADAARLDWLEAHPFTAYRERDLADDKLSDHFTLVDEDNGRKQGRRGIVEPTLRRAIDVAIKQ